MVHGKIDTEGLDFEVVMDDVETLNKKAFGKEIDITKLSYHAFAHLTKEYVLLDAGSALGNNCGPLLIAPTQLPLESLDNPDIKIAIPGKYTTANFLLSLALPKATHKVEMLFSEIEDAVLNGKTDAGLIIHENRFTYEQKGLKKIIDLGFYWENFAHAPIPLGGIVIKRNLPTELQQKVNHLIRKSVEFAFKNPLSSANFVKSNAQEMEKDVVDRHIQLYVNNYSIDLGEEGKRAVKLLFDKAIEKKIISEIKEELFFTAKMQ